MPTDIRRIVTAMEQAIEYPEEGHHEPGKAPVVTISRTMGSLGNAIGERVAEELHVACYGQQVLEEIAKLAEVTPGVMNRLHERLEEGESWLHSLITGETVRRDEYLANLATVIKWLYTQGGVIMGRGSHIVLAGRPNLLRVRITAPEEVCADRVAREDNIDFKDALKRVKDSNKARHAFVTRLFGINLEHPDAFDMVLNTAYFDDIDLAAEVIVEAVERFLPRRQAEADAAKAATAKA